MITLNEFIKENQNLKNGIKIRQTKELFIMKY